MLEPVLFLLYVNDLLDVVLSSRVARFADDTKLYHRIDNPSAAESLQEDLHSLERWSEVSGQVLNERRCKLQRIKRKRNPIHFPFTIKGKELEVTEIEKDLGVSIQSDLLWSKQVFNCCSKANKLLGLLRRSTAEVESQRTRRTLYLSVVRSTLGYATQIRAPQSIELMRKVERVQRRATKFILRLPFFCPDSYQDRLARPSLLPISYWHEYLDLVFFFKALNGLIEIEKK